MTEFSVRTVSEPKKEQSRWTSVAVFIFVVVGGIAASMTYASYH